MRKQVERSDNPLLRRRGLSTVLLVLAATSLATAATESAVVPRLADDIDISRCFDIIAGTSERDMVRCPAFLLGLVEQAQQTCREAGGTLAPQSPANVWAIDVNGDGTPELSFEYAGNLACEGAASLFECGSLGCPKVLYEEHSGTWRAIAEISADSMESVELLAPSAGQRYRTLRVGCGGETPCPEYWFYAWTGERYEPERVEVRGFPVDFAQSVHGLHGLRGATTVLATPEPGASSVGQYDATTEVAIIGTAVGSDYYYVSPCNACESGFVPKDGVRVP